MFQEQVKWYQDKTDTYETTISFYIVNSEHCQTSKMEIFSKLLYKVLNTLLLWKIVILLLNRILSAQ